MNPRKESKLQRRKSILNFEVLFFLVACSSLFLMACQPAASQKGIMPKPEVQAAKAVTDSFAVELAGKELAINENRTQITIKKSALEKEFLFMGSLISQQPIPSFSGLKSRVVAFRLINEKLFLLDANEGHQISKALPPKLVLAEFPIIKQNTEDLTFDFNSGMSKLFTENDWYSEDEEQSSNYRYNLDQSKVLVSYIDGARLSTKSNTLIIDQVAQVESKDADGKLKNLPVALKYYLSPYLPDLNFKPTQSEGLKTYGYFEIAPQLEKDGSSFIRVSKWDISHSIRFAISANTPKEFRQPITDSVLYWNHIIGKEVLQVIQLEDEKITAPDPDYNIIQWVENDAAGMAYADAQMDPRTGQILHAQIYMTSVFGTIGKMRAERNLRDDKANKKISLRGFRGSLRSSIYCRYESQKALATLEQSLGPTSEKIFPKDRALQIAQDYVREVVTHEVGHTLGLRHNFAGSLAANFPAGQRLNFFSEYLKLGRSRDEFRASSSVMDYLFFEESSMLGNQIARGVGGLTYDQQALQHLYLERSFDSHPAFCTDSDVNKYQDCQRFDTGRNLVEGTASTIQQAFDTAALGLINVYIQNKVPKNLSERILPVEQVALNPLHEATTDMEPRFTQYKAFTKLGGLVAVRSQYPFVSSLNEKIVKQAEVNYLHNLLKQNQDGVNGILSAFPPIADDFAERMSLKFSQLLDTEGYGSGSWNGIAYSFSEEEKKVMRANAKIYMVRLQEELVRLDLLSLSGASEPKETPAVEDDADKPEVSDKAEEVLLQKNLGEDLIKVIKQRVDKYVFQISGEVIPVKLSLLPEEGEKKAQTVKTISAKLPRFKYSYEIRLAAVKLLSESHSEDIAFGIAEKANYVQRFKKMITKILNVDDLDKVDLNHLSHEEVQWLLENKKILEVLTTGSESGNDPAPA